MVVRKERIKHSLFTVNFLTSYFITIKLAKLFLPFARDWTVEERQINKQGLIPTRSYKEHHGSPCAGG